MEARVTVDECHVGGVWHQREYVRCGKRRCKCNMGALHGPYWYAYHWKEKRRKGPNGGTGRWVSKYVGKELGAERDPS
jgi:hypothetical protein